MEKALKIIDVLESNGHSAYFVGGCVRDEYMGRIPKDFDVATSAKPEEIKSLFDTINVGESFGVFIVDGVEVASFREDVGTDGRRPESIHYSNILGDASRRDFTINAMYVDGHGNLVDFFGGENDIEDHIIRFVGNPQDRINEDYLRMLRAIRFATQLDFEIEDLGVIKNNAHNVVNISAERIEAELTKILMCDTPSIGFKLLLDSNLLQYILPEVARLQGVEQPREYHQEGDVWTHTMLAIDAVDKTDSNTVWATLLHDIGKPDCMTVTDRIRFTGHEDTLLPEYICRRLKMSNDRIETIKSLVSNHMRMHKIFDMRRSKVKKIFRLPEFKNLLDLHRADLVGSNRTLETYNAWKLLNFPEEEVRPKPLLNGYDLMALGWVPGPKMGEALRALEDAQLEGEVIDRIEATNWLNANFVQSKQ